jgi:photosystem II stability/assembly factor-like uncharacterized protein
MNLTRPSGKTVWLAGHLVFKKSDDEGADWSDGEPDGLPTLDIDAFVVDPRDPRTVYAAVASKGLYRSRDGGDSFTRLSSEVGGAVTGLAVMPDGRILAAEYKKGRLISADDGKTWTQPKPAPRILGLAVNPDNQSSCSAPARAWRSRETAAAAGETRSTSPTAPAQSPGRPAAPDARTSSGSTARPTGRTTGGDTARREAGG